MGLISGHWKLWQEDTKSYQYANKNMVPAAVECILVSVYLGFIVWGMLLWQHSKAVNDLFLMELLYCTPVSKTVVRAFLSIWVHLVHRSLLRRSESWYIVHSGKHSRSNPSLFHEQRGPKEVRWSQDHTQLIRVGVGVSVRIFVVVLLLQLQNNRNSLC